MSTASLFPDRRRLGVTLPLFSARTQRSWGIGEITDLVPVARWLRTSGASLLQLLPLGEISGGETSPYAALSAFGLDPTYVSVDHLDGMTQAELTAALGGAEGRKLLANLKARKQVDYAGVRALKGRVLRAAFQRFQAKDLGAGTSRAQRFAAFRGQQSEWLDDYALFRALKDAHGGKPWWQWDGELRDRRSKALSQARSELAAEIAYHAWVQWVAHEQWATAREELKRLGVALMGDLPFMVGRDSADVWAHREEFRDDVSVGVPPDQFDAEGQDWDLPAYDWSAMGLGGFAWLRRRAAYMGRLYDCFRVDHLIGFYRTYSRPRAKKRQGGKLVEGSFDPAHEAEQLAHGEAVLGAMIEGAASQGARIIAEDLGIVPDWVRASLTRLRIPGYRVLIWEKDGATFRDPRAYPALSVACFGTHDTAPVAHWWEQMPAAERAELVKLPELAEQAHSLQPRFDGPVYDALIELLCASGSDLALLMVQDLLGTQERINTPGTVHKRNWTFRLPATVETLAKDKALLGRFAHVARCVSRNGRA